MNTRKICRDERTPGRKIVYAADLMKLHPPDQEGDEPHD